ncbi:DUF5343 domain-containing protein [Anaeromyxobacter sp. Red801]|uniref:DUF5343 domain-containing protein n=1 Tax=Anaeromyxobacter sp. Red801 TaxID=3411632 RepID=UPI003BA0A688
MPANLPYLASYKNVGVLFDRIASAKAPDAFTTRYLSETIGLKSAGDRQLIGLLKTLGFLDPASSRPTPEYGRLKNRQVAKAAIAEGIRRAYAPLYDSNEDAHKLDLESIKGLVAQVAGSDESMTKRIVGTYNALVKVADFSGVASGDSSPDVPEKVNGGESPAAPFRAEPPMPVTVPKGMRSEFHFNIQVHLPSNGTEETYLNIFNAIRRTFS